MRLSLEDINFTVTFSEAVTGVDASDFSVTVSGLSGVTITGVSGSGAVYTVPVYVGSGFSGASGTIRLDVIDNDSIKDVVTYPLGGTGLGNGAFTSGTVYRIWTGGISITSDKNVVAVGRPHVGSEIASYGGVSTGALTAYIPMLFKDAFGGSYDSAFYIQNVDVSTANIDIEYYDSTGALTCSSTDTIASHASKGYWLPSTCVPAGWVGGVVVTSDQNIVAIGRPHIGTEVMTYNSFSSGSLTSYVPMLFKGAYGGTYNAASSMFRMLAGHLRPSTLNIMTALAL